VPIGAPEPGATGSTGTTEESSPFGTGTAAWQNGHFTFLPDDSSRARNRFPHDGQPSVIGMFVTLEG